MTDTKLDGRQIKDASISSAKLNFSVGQGVDIQTFTGSGTWTKPAGSPKKVLVQLWGGGGSGGKATATVGASGGGGGAYNEAIFESSNMGATETVTVGAGGASQTTASTAGSVGGTTTFGNHLKTYGGGAGNNGNIGQFGGGGGGTAGPGATGNNSNANISATVPTLAFKVLLSTDWFNPAGTPRAGYGGLPTAGVPRTTDGLNTFDRLPAGKFGGGAGGSDAVASSVGTTQIYYSEYDSAIGVGSIGTSDGGFGIYGGAGGGARGTATVQGGLGGSSIFGGGGGGGGAGDSAPGAGGGGLSRHGGAGGAGAFDANNATAGSQPGGGGGGSEIGNSGAGGAGKCIVTTFY